MTKHFITYELKDNIITYAFSYHDQLTDHFLGPDPEPDPPHVAVIYDAHKRVDIMNQIQMHKPNVLSYGYFTNDVPGQATLIADSTYKYEKIRHKAM